MKKCKRCGFDESSLLCVSINELISTVAIHTCENKNILSCDDPLHGVRGFICSGCGQSFQISSGDWDKTFVDCTDNVRQKLSDPVQRVKMCKELSKSQ